MKMSFSELPQNLILSVFELLNKGLDFALTLLIY